MADRKRLPGKSVWYELVTRDTKKAQAFYAEVLGWRVQPFQMGAMTYEMIYAGDTMIGGYAPFKAKRTRQSGDDAARAAQGANPRWRPRHLDQAR